MRLIDADNIISVCEILSEKGSDPHYWGQLISIIKDMPTVDAIPVEWLENRLDTLCFEAMGAITLYGNQIEELAKSINEVMKLWREEQ